ncbi:hypothetical protein Q31a_48710 [Aureliella helgolandensis]|uniref:Uncharacterized protein n=1 Tax=Aureliella helgolandensis TaxID=2527968 RepID=A0A518GD52_9BACT|nr:hypothetical protein Q31a_48710 [Aureliella helgolandensis]
MRTRFGSTKMRKLKIASAEEWHCGRVDAIVFTQVGTSALPILINEFSFPRFRQYRLYAKDLNRFKLNRVFAGQSKPVPPRPEFPMQGRREHDGE